MRLPTNEEIEKAYEGFDADGPIPLAGVIDQNACMHQTEELLEQAIMNRQIPIKDIIKTAMVTGLNIGIRVGEARRIGPTTQG